MAQLVPTQELGKTGEEVSILGLGGYHIGKLEEKESIQLIREAIDAGITFMDNAWCYHNGLSEKLMGKALQDGYRKKVFLMTKNHGRSKARFEKQLEDSLKRLQTNHIDLLQFHEIIHTGEPAKISQEGALEAALAAKQAGKIRYIGFTGHRHPHLHQQMLDLDFPWDTVQMPVNLFDYHYKSFQNQIIPQALEQNMGAIGMKSLLGDNFFSTEVDISVEEAIKYALSTPISVLVSGIDSLEVLEQNLEIVKDFQPYSEAEMDELRDKVQQAAFTGEYEYYKHE